MLAIDDPGKALGSPHSKLFGDLRATQPGLRGAALASSDFFTGLLDLKQALIEDSSSAKWREEARNPVFLDMFTFATRTQTQGFE